MSARGVAWWAEQQRDVSMSSTTAIHYWSVDSNIGEAECVCASVSILSIANCIIIHVHTVHTWSVWPHHSTLTQVLTTNSSHYIHALANNLLNIQHTVGPGYPEEPNHWNVDTTLKQTYSHAPNPFPYYTSHTTLPLTPLLSIADTKLLDTWQY